MGLKALTGRPRAEKVVGGPGLFASDLPDPPHNPQLPAGLELRNVGGLLAPEGPCLPASARSPCSTALSLGFGIYSLTSISFSMFFSIWFSIIGAE